MKGQNLINLPWSYHDTVQYRRGDRTDTYYAIFNNFSPNSSPRNDSLSRRIKLFFNSSVGRAFNAPKKTVRCIAIQ